MGIFDYISSAVSTVTNVVTAPARYVYHEIEKPIDQAVHAVESVVMAPVKFVGSAVQAPINFVMSAPKTIQHGMGTIYDDVAAIPGSILSAGGAVRNEIVRDVTGVIDYGVKTETAIAGIAVNAADKLISSTGKAAGDVLPNLMPYLAIGAALFLLMEMQKSKK